MANTKRYTINPNTGRRILINGRAYKSLYTTNPKTNRPILINGHTFRKLQISANDSFYRDANKELEKLIKQDLLKDDIKKLQREARAEVQRLKAKKEQTRAYIDKHYIGQFKNVIVSILFFRKVNINQGADIPRAGEKRTTIRGITYTQILKEDFDFSRLNKKDINKYMVRGDDSKKEFETRIYNKYTKYEISGNFKKTFKRVSQSQQIDAIYIFNPRELIRPLGQKRLTLPRLFARNKINDSNNNVTIINKFINYDLNKDAQTFGELFDVSLCKYAGDNYRANSCFINIIIDTYYDQFNKKKPDGTRYYKHSLTYPYLCALLQLENKNQDIGLTVDNSIKFFDTYGLGLKLINSMGEIVRHHEPANRSINKKIYPAVLNLLIHNNHVIKINKDVSKFAQLDTTERADDIKALWISNKFNIRKQISETEAPEFVHINNINDIMIYIKDNEETKAHFILNVSKCDMNKLLYEMVNIHKVVPNVKMAGHRLIYITFNINNISYIIEPNTDTKDTEDENEHEISPDEYLKYIEYDNAFYNSIIYERVKSEYPPEVLHIDDNYKMSPQTGYFTPEYMNINILNGVDMCKAYTACLSDVDNVPVFGHFNRYREYIKGEQIDPLKIYVIKNDINNSKWYNVLLFHKKYDRVYGSVLLEANKHNIHYNIIYVRDYERLEQVEYKKAVDTLYNTTLHKDSKKFIVNKVTGLLEQKKAKRGMSYIYNTYAEAEMYKFMYGQQDIKATITAIECERPYTEEEEKKYNALYENPTIRTKTTTLYILTLYKEKSLIDGFRQIKELLYCHMRIKMFNLTLICLNNNMNVCGIRTDSLLLNNYEHEIRNINDIDFNDKIGCFKIEQGKTCPKTPLCGIVQRTNYYIKIDQHNINTIDILDEYDTNEINKKINLHNRLLIKSDMPGSGKSQCVKNYHNTNNNDDTINKVLFITPNNELAQDIKKEGFDAMTVYAFLGLNHNEQSINTKKDVYTKDYNIICFDEVYQIKRSILKRIDRYINEHSNIKFVATGDNAQNKAIEDDDDTGGDNFKSDNDTIINMVFNNQINLKISKRLKSEEDKQKLNKLKNQVFNMNLDISTIMKEHFKIIYNINDITTTQNVTYSNNTAQRVAEHVHNKKTYDTKKIMTLNNIVYYKNMPLVCRKAIRTQKLTLHTNYIYTLNGITKDKNIILFEPFEQIEHTITPAQFMESMRLNYARTGHSIQGRSIGENFTICDIDSSYVNRRWIWTALTRARNLNDITIYLMSEEQKDTSYQRKIEQYFNIIIKKINKNRKDKQLFNIDMIMNEIEKTPLCGHCKTPFNCVVYDGEIITNIKINTNDDKLKVCCSNCQNK